jgi:hypothetical protein
MYPSIKITLKLLVLLILFSCAAQKKISQPDTCTVDARKWSKVNGKVKYSEWGSFSAVTTDLLDGFKAIESEEFSRYGGEKGSRIKATGYFYTAKIKNRWWIVDPEGYLCWSVAVNGVRPGNSGRNEKALDSIYHSPEQWILKTQCDLREYGFNGAGCWSDVQMIQYSNTENDGMLSYTLISNFFTNYKKQRKKLSSEELSFPVFDPEFEVSCDAQAGKFILTASDPNLLGHFSDNELPFNEKILDEYLACKDTTDPNYQVASRWMKSKEINLNKISKENREEFLGVAAEQYFRVVSSAIKKYDPNHMYLGSRLHGRPKHTESIIKAAGRYAEIISINYYGHWEPLQKHFDEWSKWADKPVIITEFYTKGDDSGLPNVSGAGWRVKTQNDRGIFYENFCLKLLQMENCVGWHWFRYMDNDPTDESADPSNNDSNKGIVDNLYHYYDPLMQHMKRLNMNRYRLIKYFDSREVKGLNANFPQK